MEILSDSADAYESPLASSVHTDHTCGSWQTFATQQAWHPLSRYLSTATDSCRKDSIRPRGRKPPRVRLQRGRGIALSSP